MQLCSLTPPFFTPHSSGNAPRPVHYVNFLSANTSHSAVLETYAPAHPEACQKVGELRLPPPSSGLLGLMIVVGFGGGAA
ncbi:hypothetical protein J1614_010589 [Plenodomus biglobosus]|nr:hypothetical protein J1614_010589 [Plenodomus biglobosus]